MTLRTCRRPRRGLHCARASVRAPRPEGPLRRPVAGRPRRVRRQPRRHDVPRRASGLLVRRASSERPLSRSRCRPLDRRMGHRGGRPRPACGAACRPERGRTTDVRPIDGPTTATAPDPVAGRGRARPPRGRDVRPEHDRDGGVRRIPLVPSDRLRPGSPRESHRAPQALVAPGTPPCRRPNSPHAWDFGDCDDTGSCAGPSSTFQVVE
jgi:hypothetical protein